MKKINIQKIILVLIPVLFIFSGAAKADTFTYNGYTFTTQTDKPIYTEGANGGGDTATVIVSLNQSPSPKLMGANSSYSIQSFSSKANMYAESPQNYFSSATSYNNYSNNSYSSYSFSFEVGTTATSSQAAAYNNYYSYWDTSRDYRVVNSLELIPYSGQHDYISPYVWFNVQLVASTSSACVTSTSTPGVWRNVQVGIYHYIDGSSNGHDYMYNGAGTKNVTYLDISPNNYNGKSFFLWNQYVSQTSSLPSSIDLSTASYSGSSITDLFNTSHTPCSAYSGSCIDYDYFAANDGFYDTLWYFPDGIHTTQQNPLVDLSNSESSEGPAGTVGGNVPSSVGTADAITGTVASNNCNSNPPAIFSK